MRLWKNTNFEFFDESHKFLESFNLDGIARFEDQAYRVVCVPNLSGVDDPDRENSPIGHSFGKSGLVAWCSNLWYSFLVLQKNS